MRTKKIAICAVQVPFMHGGAEKLTGGLYVELLKRGLNVEMINVPFKWYPADRLITECMIWRLLDISENDGKKIDVSLDHIHTLDPIMQNIDELEKRIERLEKKE